MDQETKSMLYASTIENVTNVDSFPEIKLVDPAEELEQKLIIEKKPNLLRRLFSKWLKH